MKKKNALKNVAASVRDRLLNVMMEKGQDYNVLLTRYAIERLLFRLAASKYRNQFILKGAMLFVAWQHIPHRVTKDEDLLGFGDSSPEVLKALKSGSVIRQVFGLTRTPLQIGLRKG